MGKMGKPKDICIVVVIRVFPKTKLKDVLEFIDKRVSVDSEILYKKLYTYPSVSIYEISSNIEYYKNISRYFQVMEYIKVN